MKNILVTAAIFLSMQGFAQTVATPCKLRFTSLNQVGLLLGNNGESYTLQSINGVRKNNWFAGLGTGFDFYGQRSVPLFVDIRRQFFKSSNKPFLYLDGGVSFQWLNFIQKEQRGFPDTNPGVFYEAGLGYNIYMRRQSAFVLSAGYGYKRIRENFTNYRSLMGVYRESKEQRVSEYRRYVIKMGIRI